MHANTQTYECMQTHKHTNAHTNTQGKFPGQHTSCKEQLSCQTGVGDTGLLHHLQALLEAVVALPQETTPPPNILLLRLFVPQQDVGVA